MTILDKIVTFEQAMKILRSKLVVQDYCGAFYYKFANDNNSLPIKDKNDNYTIYQISKYIGNSKQKQMKKVVRCFISDYDNTLCFMSPQLITNEEFNSFVYAPFKADVKLVLQKLNKN